MVREVKEEWRRERGGGSGEGYREAEEPDGRAMDKRSGRGKNLAAQPKAQREGKDVEGEMVEEDDREGEVVLRESFKATPQALR